jgi:hypothetical protein
LVDGKIGVDDALAILDLVVGTNFNSKKFKVVNKLRVVAILTTESSPLLLSILA